MSPALTGLHGWIDRADRNEVRGWSQDARHPGKPIELDVTIAATATQPPRLLSRVLANAYRRDRDPGRTLHQGRVGFAVSLEQALLPAHSFFLDVRNNEGEAVPGAPILLPEIGFSGASSTMQLSGINGHAVACLPPDMQAWRGIGPGNNTTRVQPGVAILALLAPPLRTKGDNRRLGVPLYDVTLDGVTLDLTSPALAQGFYPIEKGDDGALWRWSADVAFFNLGPSDCARTLTLVAGAGAGRAPPTPWHLSAQLSTRLPGSIQVGGRTFGGKMAGAASL